MQARWISRIQKGFLILGVGGALTACKGDDPWEPDAEWIAMAGGDADSELAKRLNVELRLILPREPKKNWVFDGYTNSRTGEVAWSRSWTSKIDFTGVSWDKSKNLTMITPRHALMAKHYMRKHGDTVVFHDREGQQVKRVLVGMRKLPGVDVGVGILDEAVPPGIKIYKLLEPSESFATDLVGALALITDNERLVHVHEISAIRGTYVSFQQARTLPEGFFEDLVRGDSGNPSFLMVRGEPVLLETHHFGGAGSGPFLGDAQIQEGIALAIADLAPTAGGGEYAISTVVP